MLSQLSKLEVQHTRLPCIDGALVCQLLSLETGVSKVSAGQQCRLHSSECCTAAMQHEHM